MATFRKTRQTHTANSICAMETRDHLNGVSPKNHRSRRNFKKMMSFFTIIMVISTLFAVAGCKSKKTLPSVQAGSPDFVTSKSVNL